MEVLIVATKDCFHRKNLIKELKDIGIEYEISYVEDAPELVERFNIRHSPNLIIDGIVKFRRQPTERELHECLKVNDYEA